MEYVYEITLLWTFRNEKKKTNFSLQSISTIRMVGEFNPKYSSLMGRSF